MDLTDRSKDLAAFSVRWDRRDDFDPRDEVLDGDVGEDAQGVWASVHPYALLLEEPDLWGPWSRFKAGDQEPHRDDFDRLSNFELQCKSTLRAASTRHLTRKPPGAPS